MDIQTLVLNSYNTARVVLISAINLTLVLAILSNILDKRHSYKYILICYGFKTIILTWLCLYVSYEYLLSDSRFMIFYLLILFMYGIFLLYVHIYTFQASVIKVLIISALCEIFVSFLGTANLIICNLLEQRQEILLTASRLSLMDGVYLILSLIEWKIIKKTAQNLFKKLNKWEVKHEKVWFIFIFIYFFAGFTTMQVEFRMNFSIVVWAIIVCGFTFLLLGTSVGVLAYRSYRREVIRTHEFLKKQKEFVNFYTQNIYMQIHEIKSFNQMVDTQMKQLLSNGTCYLEKENIVNYLDQLKRQYDSFEAGRYCKDWMIDSILCYMGRYFEKTEISYHFNFQNYDRGNIQIEDIAEIVFQLLHLPAENLLTLRCSAFKNWLIFEFSGAAVKKKALNKAICSILEKYDGFMSIDKQNIVRIQLTRNK